MPGLFWKYFALAVHREHDPTTRDQTRAEPDDHRLRLAEVTGKTRAQQCRLQGPEIFHASQVMAARRLEHRPLSGRLPEGRGHVES